jgi:hypothetical protein
MRARVVRQGPPGVARDADVRGVRTHGEQAAGRPRIARQVCDLYLVGTTVTAPKSAQIWYT